jgi:hypothetical protein
MFQEPTMATRSSSFGDALNDYMGGQDEDLKKDLKIADLNRLYSDADSADQMIFAEMRSNLLLVAGEHYNKRDSLFYRRIRDSKDLSSEQKVRLTKNHIRKICQLYANNIMSMNPGVGFMPKDDSSLHDQKVAELHHSVWQDAFVRYNLDDAMDDWCDNMIQIGEVHNKIFFDPNKGRLKGYEAQTDEMGQPVVDFMGNQQVDESKPIYEGEFVFEEIYGFNLLRPNDCRDLQKAEWLGLRKMVDIATLLLSFPDKKDFIKKSQDDTFMVFDAAYGGYTKAENQVSVREYYYRPSMKYPRGYFYITTKEGILAQGELPGGIFPIVSQVFDKIQTTARGRSPIKQMRPYQIEINRSGSKIAEHQVTLGDDKLLIQNGTKVSAGVSLPGVRSISFTGQAPTVLAGRSGEQYTNYMMSQIAELYQVMGVQEDSTMKNPQQDPWMMLYQSARNKKVFQRYIKKFEKYLIQIVKTYISLAKVHLADDALIYAIGKNEQINIPEFKAMPDLSFEVKVEAQADDVETKLGQQMSINHALQYVGNTMGKEEIGKLMDKMPYANFEGCFDDFTRDDKMMTNEILALDRGDQPPVNESDNHAYAIKRLNARMKEPDFQFLPPQVKQAYQQKMQLHQEMDAFQKDQIRRAEQGFIPTSGYLVSCQFYVTDPTDPSGMKTRQARVPSDSMSWLLDKLKVQGSAMATFDGQDQNVQAGQAQILNQQAPGPMGPAAGQNMAHIGAM